MIKKILIAPDKFKGSLSGAEICHILKTELVSKVLGISIDECPMADGGDGSLEVLKKHLGLNERMCATVDPLGRSIVAPYYVGAKTAYIELASASGLVLLEDNERSPMLTSTYGTGLQMLDAVKNGIEHIYLFLGGSATNDGGIGIASAFDYKFYDENENELQPIGFSLSTIRSIKSSIKEFKNIKLTLCCDVENPPFGPSGAASVYAKQKGGSPDEIADLDFGLENLCNRIKDFNGLDYSQLIGGGAAGGVPICLVGLFDGAIISGTEFFIKTTKLHDKIANCDLVISGEGRLDSQSLDGKVISGIAEICDQLDKRFWLVVGQNELAPNQLKNLSVDKLFEVAEYVDNLEDAIKHGQKYMQIIGSEIALFINQIDDVQ